MIGLLQKVKISHSLKALRAVELEPHCILYQKIEMFQRRNAEWVLINFSEYSSVSDMLGSLGCGTLEQRRTDLKMVLLF